VSIYYVVLKDLTTGQLTMTGYIDEAAFRKQEPELLRHWEVEKEGITLEEARELCHLHSPSPIRSNNALQLLMLAAALGLR
jgi:hypothetical protein